MKRNAVRVQYRRDLWQLFTQPGKAVEIGVAEGNFSEDMLKWKAVYTDRKGAFLSHTLTQLYMVDRWASVPTQSGDASMSKEWHEKNFEKVEERIKPYGKRPVILRGDSVAMSEEVADESLFLVYVDGDHSYEGVFRDIRAWAPKIKPGGYMAFHDYENPNYGVKQAVHDFCADNFQVIIMPEDKAEDAGCYFQIK